MAKKPQMKKMAKRNFPSNKERAAMTQHAKDLNMSQRLQAYGTRMSNEEIGRKAADIGTAGLVPNKAGQKMQAGKKLKTPQMGRDIPLPKSNY